MFKRKIKPIVFYLPENVREMFVDVEFLDEYRKSGLLHEHWYQGLKLIFGIDIFVFDVKACEFFDKGSKNV